MKVSVSLILAFIITLSAQTQQDSVQLYRAADEDRIAIKAKNTNLFPITLQVEFELKNLRSNRNAPYIFVIGSQSDVEIIEFEIINETENWNYSYEYSYYIGSIYARHNDNFAYRLPYNRGSSFFLSQGFGGAFSHLEHQEFALDFTMPEGTPVYAARGGIVVDAEEKFSVGGNSRQYLEKANYVTILHDDGTLADYAHLKHNGVEVRIGQQVRTGQLIGYSGATGFASGPHLHFVVRKAKIGAVFESIPVKFATKDGIIQLEEGNTYLGY